MKKTFLLLAAFLLIGMVNGNALMAQGHIDLGAAKSAQNCTSITNDGFNATFSFSSIDAVEVNTEKGVFSTFDMSNTYPSGMVGDPCIPVANKLFAVPFGVDNVTVEVKSYTTETYKLAEYGINRLYPQQPLLRKDQDPKDIPFEFNEKTYAFKGYAERPIAEVAIKGTLRGIQVGTLTINPIQYDAVDNSIRVYNNIEVEVSYGKYDQAAAYQEFARTFSPYFAGVYSQMFNFRDGIYDQHPDLWQNPVKMLVIANRMFESCIQDWVAWKTTKGFYVDVRYTDEIGTNANAIKTFIQQQYAENAPTFLMIMGDKDQVPASATGSATQCVTDLYYMSPDGDEFADIFHSRFPAETVAQMQSMLSKALEYEQLTMPDPSYLGNVLLIAGEDSGWGVTVGRPTIWYATNYYYNEAHGFNNVYEYSHGTYTGCYNNLNTGVGFVNYTAHGSNTSWAGPSFTNSDVNNLTNEHKYFLAMGNCCQAADWGINGPCFGETMVRAENKAAYAYIGSCPSTYWLNDYYFGVGATSVANGTMPNIEQTTMGCYDAIWQDDAYNTVCAIPFVGNLASNQAQALGYTLHINTLYCWQAYHVLGDGSVLPFRVEPTANDVSHLPTLPIGMATYEVTAAPGSYVGISKDGVLYGAGMIDETGTTQIAITPITSGGDVTICVTHPQHIPYIATVPAASLDGAYLVYDDYEVLHEVTPGSWVPMNVSVKNVGSDVASNVTVTLSTESEYVSIVNDEATVESIATDGNILIEDVFSFDVAVNVPDKEKIVFNVTCTDGEHTWESRFNVTAAAPQFAIVNITNTEFVAGGSGTITFEIDNTGSADATNVVFETFSSSSDIEILNSTINIESIPAGRGASFTVDVNVGEEVALGSTYEMLYMLTSGHYNLPGSYVFCVGNIVEGFETGDFSMYDWVLTGANNWTIVSDEVNSGSYAAKSGQITDNGETHLSLTVDILADGEISFYRKVSSENNYDKLFFYIDGAEKNNWSGDQGWAQVSYPITTGTHTFKWTYKKDYSVSGGQDCAWIDDIQFPPTSVTLALDVIEGLESVVDNYDVTISWNATEKATNYIIRRDGVEIAQTTETSYTETLTDGIYNYCVIARDDEGHSSAPAYITVNVGMVSVEENHTTIDIYPNPAKDNLILNVNADFNYSIFNSMGQEVMTGTSNGEVRLNVSNLAKGIYVVRIVTQNENRIQKVIVE